jgi:two-component system, sensor histidine kinase RpfC
MGVVLRSLPGRLPGLAQRAVPAALAGVALLPPLALLGLPQVLAAVGPTQSGVVLVSALLLAPALVGLALALNGPEAIAAARFAAASRGEHRQALLRLLFCLAAFLHALALAGVAAASLTVVTLALVAAWLFVLHLVLAPAPSRLRRHLTLLADIGFLSAFLRVGGASAAAWYPMYLVVALDNGWRFGVASLLQTAVLAAGGFALAAALTPFWQQNLALTAGLVAALAVVPGLAVRPLRGLAAMRAAAEAACAARARLLVALAEALAPLLRRSDGAAPPLEVAAEELLAPLDALRDLAADAEPAASGLEVFDLPALVNDAVAGLRGAAAARGVAVGWRIDPHLPGRVRGRPRLLHRLLTLLLGDAVRHAEGKVRLGVDMVAGRGASACVKFTLRDPGTSRDNGFGLLVAEELAALLGARMAREGETQQKPGLITVELEFAPAEDGRAIAVDLGQLPVLIASPDAEFAHGVAARVAAWGGAARWIGGFDMAAASLAEPGEAPPVLILDGRSDVLQALGLAERAAGLRPQQPPFMLFVAEPPWVDSLANLGDSDLAAILPAPLNDGLLRNALHAVSRPQPDIADPALSGGMPARPLVILVAEDDAANRAVIERVLSVAGHRVQLAKNGEEALAALERGGIDLVLMDIGMPRISGFEAARLYRMMRARPPIIALTGDASAETERLCREAGMDGVLTKPIEPDRLIAAVAAAIGGEAPAKPASVVTSITAHPRFAGDSPTPIDADKVAALRSLGGGSDFFRDVVEAFHSDSREILDDIARAAVAIDIAGFRDGVHALRSCAANVGGTRLVELLQSMPAPSARELRHQGAAFVQQLGAELIKLDAALLDCLSEAEASRR